MRILTLILTLLMLAACHSPTFKNGPVSAKPNATANTLPALNGVSKIEQAKLSELEKQNEKFKVVPEGFNQIDFKNYSYPYRFDYGRRINIALNNGEYEYDIENDRGWFSLSDVYYVDLTEDGNPEAIVILWHVSCGGSCDGGAAVFYIYAAHQNKLKPLWQYETGSLAYGCGLKSFTAKRGKLTMELFGRCFDEIEESLGMGKFQVKDTTHLTIGFNGRKFIEEKKRFISVPERSVLNYKADISIDE